MMVMEHEMHIEAYQARAMLRAMGYECEALGYVADIPPQALAAVRQVWDQARGGNLRINEVDSVLGQLYSVMLEQGRRRPTP